CLLQYLPSGAELNSAFSWPLMERRLAHSVLTLRPVTSRATCVPHSFMGTQCCQPRSGSRGASFILKTSNASTVLLQRQSTAAANGRLSIGWCRRLVIHMLVRLGGSRSRVQLCTMPMGHPCNYLASPATPRLASGESRRLPSAPCS